ncbi:MAG: YebC/PmpR family DNA-binding transcriptional regulator, partial [Oscillospiraceae bacterium]|nr:YebC/PmpR family DNA-binding transcriptional regulator [Oscillospiraceae bacterium]
KRSIQKASGELSNVVYEEITYEGYAPGGVAVIVKTITDNRNRTASDVRHCFAKNGGNLGTTGSVSFMFDEKGLLVVEKTPGIDEEELMMQALDAGAEDMSTEEDAIGYFAPKVNCVKLSCLQFLVCGAISVVVMFIFEKPNFENILQAWLPIIYAGALSGGAGYTLQTIAQKWTKPSVASLLMSFESVFAVLAGAVILQQIPTLREGIGCVLMFISIILIQFSENRKKGAE